jgi:hypothetical protein
MERGLLRSGLVFYTLSCIFLKIGIRSARISTEGLGARNVCHIHRGVMKRIPGLDFL